MVRLLPLKTEHIMQAVLTAVEVATSESDKLIEGVQELHDCIEKKCQGESIKLAFEKQPKLEQMAVLLKKTKIEYMLMPIK
jgi:hypothetical protein